MEKVIFLKQFTFCVDRETLAACIMFRYLLFIFLLTSISCHLVGGPQPSSILIIAIEGLGFDDISCDLSRVESGGFKDFCNESIYFTHAFTPSTMSLAAMTSVLTGEFPLQHSVRHNGDWLRARKRTIPELALDQGFRTGFFSSGAPFFRKSGLNQGFEVFDDHTPVGIVRQYRPVETNFDLLFSWVSSHFPQKPFFGVSYISDLKFPHITTQTRYGEDRSRSYQGQLKEVGESLEDLIKNLKSKGIWNNTNVVLMGLNGHSSQSRVNEVANSSLFHERSQVALFIKPSRVERDQAKEWNVDANVSLVDVGATLLSWLGVKPYSKFQTVSLEQVLKGSNVNWDLNREIIIETAWPEWRSIGGIRYSIRKGDLLYILDKEISIFNTLTDRYELTQINRGDPLWKKYYKEVEGYIKTHNLYRWQPPSGIFLEKIKLAKKLWSPQGLEDLVDLRHLIDIQNGEDKQLVGWLAHEVLVRGHWSELETLGKAYSKQAWTVVAQARQKKPYKIEGEGCLGLFKLEESEAVVQQNCDNELLITLVRWVLNKNGNRRDRYRKKFWRMFVLSKIDEKIYRHNYWNGLAWDVTPSLPAEPSLVDLYLAMPQSRSQANFLNRELARIFHKAL